MGFEGVAPEATDRPSYHPAGLLKLYIYGYLNRVQSSRRLEREAGRNVEVMCLTGRLIPDHKTIADFRKDSGPAIKRVCVRFIELCRLMGLLTTASVAIDGSKFKAVNNRDKNFTRGKVERRRAQLEKSVARYLAQLDTADLQEPSEELAAKTAHLNEKLVKLESEMQRLAELRRHPRHRAPHQTRQNANAAPHHAALPRRAAIRRPGDAADGDLDHGNRQRHWRRGQTAGHPHTGHPFFSPNRERSCLQMVLT